MTEAENRQFERLWNEGVPMRAIALNLCYSEKYLYSYAARHRSHFPYRQQRVTTCNTAKVTRLASQGVAHDEIARKYGLNKQTVARILERSRA